MTIERHDNRGRGQPVSREHDGIHEAWPALCGCHVSAFESMKTRNGHGIMLMRWWPT